jgi:hypothetical protein
MFEAPSVVVEFGSAKPKMGILTNFVMGKDFKFTPGYGNVVWFDGMMSCCMPLGDLYICMKMTNTNLTEPPTTMQTEAAHMEMDEKVCASDV